MACADPGSVGLVARDLRTGVWVSYEPGEFLDAGGVDAGVHETLPDNWHDGVSWPIDDYRDRAVPAEMELVPPGPVLAGLLARVDESQADAYDLVELAAGWARVAAWVAARQATVLAELAARPEQHPGGATGYRSINPVTVTAVEIAARTQITTRQAENQVGCALQLVHDFPATHAALAAGSIDERRAGVIAKELGGQEPAVRARVEGAVLPDAPTMDSVTLRRRVTALLHAIAPVTTAQRCRAARERRYVAIVPASDGMAHLDALLPAEDAVALNTALDGAATSQRRHDRASGRPARTHDQHRADALATLAWAALVAGGAPTGADTTPTGGADTSRAGAAGGAAEGVPATGAVGGRSGYESVGGAVGGTAEGVPATGAVGGRSGCESVGTHTATTLGQAPVGAAAGPAVSVQVTIPFTTLTGLADQPGELAGYGPIPAHVARELAAHGVWTWLGTHPTTGQLLDCGRTRYRPPRALAEFVVARDRTCRIPGCHRPAARCDIDHVSAYADGGSTSAANCHCLCEPHHLLKHRSRWRVERHSDGTTSWTSPTGHRYVKPSDPVLPVAQPPPESLPGPTERSPGGRSAHPRGGPTLFAADVPPF